MPLYLPCFAPKTTSQKTMNHRLAEQVVESANDILDSMITTHHCGWFDGGCYTLAYAIHQRFPKTELMHISRSAEDRDHAVIFIPNLSLYLDADGLQSHAQLFHKMRTSELTQVNTILPFYDIHKFPIFPDIVKQLQQKFTAIENTA